MSNTEFKKAFDNVEPDIYMQSRMLANIRDKKKKHFPFKPVLSGALALVVAIGCFGAVHNHNSFSDRPFSVMVVDASDDVPVTSELSDDVVLVPNLKIGYSDHESVTSEGDVGFYVSGEDIDYVQYQSKTGSFYGYDHQKELYDKQNREYFTAVIPVADNEVRKILDYIDSQMMNPETAGIKHYAETHDLSEYFGSDDVDFRDYWVYFEKCSDMVGYQKEKGYAFFVIEEEKASQYYFDTRTDDDPSTDLTVYNYDLSEETLNSVYPDYLECVYKNFGYSPDEAIGMLLENPDMNKSELPGDEITIIATFKDGKRAKKVISVSYNEDGCAQFELIS